MPHFVYPFIHPWAFGLFPHWYFLKLPGDCDVKSGMKTEPLVLNPVCTWELFKKKNKKTPTMPGAQTRLVRISVGGTREPG